MNLLSRLLRLLLCVCVAVNGLGDALAAATTTPSDATHEVGRQGHDAIAAASARGCHRTVVDVACAMSESRRDAMDGHSGRCWHGTRDCCTPGSSACHCMAQAACVLVEAVATHDAGSAAAPERSAHNGYAAPRLPHLKRPPIG